MSEGCVNIYRAYTRHVQPQQSISGRVAASTNPVNHHLYVSVADIGQVGDTVLYCQLYSERRDTWVSERWWTRAEGQHTLFTDVGGAEQGADIYCVFTVYRLGKIVNQQVTILEIPNQNLK